MNTDCHTSLAERLPSSSRFGVAKKKIRIRVVPALALADTEATHPQAALCGRNANSTASPLSEWNIRQGRGPVFDDHPKCGHRQHTCIHTVAECPGQRPSSRTDPAPPSRYSQPPRMRKYVMSETHFRPGLSAWKSRSRTFPHTPRPCPESVARGRHHPRWTFSPFSRIRRAT